MNKAFFCETQSKRSVELPIEKCPLKKNRRRTRSKKVTTLFLRKKCGSTKFESVLVRSNVK